MKTFRGFCCILILANAMAVCGCGASPVLNVFNDSGIDAKKDANGNVILLDTPRMWNRFVQITNITIANELAGDTHWGKSKNANEEWLRVIHRIQKDTEHPQKYINYIIEQRRADSTTKCDA